MSLTFIDLPETEFPDQIDQRMISIDPASPEDIGAIRSFQAAMESDDMQLASQILIDYPRLRRMLINASKWNRHEDMIIAIQRMWDSDISEYLRAAIERVGAGVAFEQVYGLVQALAGKAELIHDHTDKQNKIVPKPQELSSEGWVGDTAPYTQQVAVNGITETCDLLVFPQCVTDDQIEAWAEGKVAATDQEVGKVTFTATGDKPQVALPFMVINLG